MGATVSVPPVHDLPNSPESMKRVPSWFNISMRSSTSNPDLHDFDAINEDFVVSMVRPVYYMKEEVTQDELNQATQVWKSILNNRSEYYLKFRQENKEKNLPTQELCANYFAELFYERLFNVHARSIELFSGTKMKMRVYFMGSITIILESLLEEPDKFHKMLSNLAKVHNRIGVKAMEYGVGCEVLMYCIRKCVGDEVFTPTMKIIWIKIFSRVLDVILPVVVQHELKLSRQGMPQTMKQVMSTSSIPDVHSGPTASVMTNFSDMGHMFPVVVSENPVVKG